MTEVLALKWVDIPPVWLAVCLGFTWGLSELAPGLAVHLAATRILGVAAVVMGCLAMLAGLVELLRQRTTFVPRQNPTGFARGGIYQLTRNPIYLGDALVLTGAVLWWDVWPALILVPGFMLFITRRFIFDEENRLRGSFGPDVEVWFGEVRRWL
ncbi:MAG: methyltransferase [Maritimibacter sp.]